MSENTPTELPEQVHRILKTSAEVRTIFAEVSSRNIEMVDEALKATRALAIAHGAAILGSLSVLDHSDEAVRQAATFYAGLFCIGFGLAIIGNFFGVYVRFSVGRRFWEPAEKNNRADLWLTGFFLIISLCILTLGTFNIGLALLGV